MIKFRPPKIAQALLLMAALLHLTTPMAEAILFLHRPLGLILGIGGFVLMMSGWRLFKELNLPLCPLTGTDRLLTSGIYRYTRNPMYLGIVSMMISVAIMLVTAPFYLAAVSYFAIINWAFCPYEEGRLSREFGEDYLNYKNSVRRWF